MGFLSSVNPLVNPISVENAIDSPICEPTREPNDVEGCNKEPL